MNVKVTRQLILLLLVLSALSGCDMIKYKKIIAATEIQTVDLKTIEDGNYEGFFDAFVLNAKVSIEIKNHKIINLELVEHKYDKFSGKPMIQKVLEKQSLEVDMITGATNSCKTVLKAIEIALNSNKVSQLSGGELQIEKSNK